MEQGEVSSFVADAKAAIDGAPEMGARNTQLRVVEPFLSMLGWDVRSPAVEAAYPVGNETVVDYALCPGGKPGAFVLVTGCDESLSRDGRDELVAAMRASAVDRGVYTNGRRYLLVALASGEWSGEESVEHVRLDLETLPEHVAALRALHRETVAANVDGGRRRAAESLVEADDAAVRAVTEAVVAVADDEVPADALEPVVSPLARRFLDAVVDELAPELDASAIESSAESEAEAGTDNDGDGEVLDASTPQATEATTAVSGSGQASAGASTAASQDQGSSSDVATDSEGEVGTLAERSESRADSDDGSEYVLRFFEDGRSVGAVGNPDPGSAIAQAVQYLLEERGLAPRLRLPYAPERDDDAFLHRDPVHPDGRPMTSAIDLGGVYVCLDADVDALREGVETLAERSGLRVMFSGDWPESE